MFCRELFGKKPQKLEFGLQPHKIPDCDVVSSVFPEPWGQQQQSCDLDPPPGPLPDALLQRSLRPVPTRPGQGPLLHQAA